MSNAPDPSRTEADRLDDLLEGILGPDVADTSPAPLADSTAPDASASPVKEAAGDARELTQEEVAALIDEDQVAGQRLARRGDCVLLAAVDAMSAYFWGKMPEGTTYRDVQQLLGEAGISFGVVQSRIYDVLPQRRPHRDQRSSRSLSRSGPHQVVVAKGRPPKPPGAARSEFAFAVLEEAAVERLQSLLENGPLSSLSEWSLPVPLVRPGQLLAGITRQPGEDGRDVFGHLVPAPPGAPGALGLGANVTAAPDGQSCIAALLGYAVVSGGAVSVLPPIWVAPDLVHAFFLFFPQPGPVPHPKPDEVRQALAQVGVTHGVLDDEIKGLCACLAKGGREVDRLILLARGTESLPGRDAHWQLLGDPVLAQHAVQLHRRLARSPDQETLNRQVEGLTGQAVAAGQQLAAKHPAVPGRPGRDVFGEEFLPEEPRDALLEASEHVQMAAGGLACHAEIYGYLGVTGRLQRLFVVTPLWVARDGMSACFVNLPHTGGQQVPTAAEIDQLLALTGVKYGINHRAIGVFLERLRQGLSVAVVVTLATGRQPERGQDGRFEFAMDRDRKPGFIRSDGSIDYKQLALAPLVDPGQLIGNRYPATPGQPGMDVAGRSLSTRDGQEVVVDLGGNVRLTRQAGQPDAYHADIQGELVVVERTDRMAPVIHLAVHPILTVPGDVDYRTGNIDYPGSVHVTGSIRSSFSVKAGGNLVVGESIEDGVAVEAAGNIVVAHGIAGSRTQVTAGGSLFARYISEARVRVRADLNVAEYLLRASVRVDGEAIVWGTTSRRASGLIAGGVVMAGLLVRAAEIGTETSGPTQLVAGVDSALLLQATRLQQSMDQYQEAINRALRSLQVERLEMGQMRQLLLNLVLRATGERRRVLARAVRSLLELQVRLREATSQHRQVDEKMEELAARAEIRVSGTVAPRTVIKIGTQVHRVAAEGGQVTGVRFALARTRGGGRQLQMTAE